MSDATTTDVYEVTMAMSYPRENMTGPATFSLLVRDLPADRGFLVAAGLEPVPDYLSGFRIGRDDIDAFASALHRPLRDLEPLRGLEFTRSAGRLPGRPARCHGRFRRYQRRGRRHCRGHTCRRHDGPLLRGSVPDGGRGVPRLRTVPPGGAGASWCGQGSDRRRSHRRRARRPWRDQGEGTHRRGPAEHPPHRAVRLPHQSAAERRYGSGTSSSFAPSSLRAAFAVVAVSALRVPRAGLMRIPPEWTGRR